MSFKCRPPFLYSFYVHLESKPKAKPNAYRKQACSKHQGVTNNIDLNNTKKSETKVQKTNRSNVEPTSQFKISYTKQGRNNSNFIKE